MITINVKYIVCEDQLTQIIFKMKWNIFEVCDIMLENQTLTYVDYDTNWIYKNDIPKFKYVNPDLIEDILNDSITKNKLTIDKSKDEIILKVPAEFYGKISILEFKLLLIEKNILDNQELSAQLLTIQKKTDKLYLLNEPLLIFPELDFIDLAKFITAYYKTDYSVKTVDKHTITFNGYNYLLCNNRFKLFDFLITRPNTSYLLTTILSTYLSIKYNYNLGILDGKLYNPNKKYIYFLYHDNKLHGYTFNDSQFIKSDAPYWEIEEIPNKMKYEIYEIIQFNPWS